MPQYRTTFAVDWSPAQAFHYMANFSNSAEWDPGVARAEQLTDDPRAVGARFAVVAKFLGRKVKLTYETVELDPPRRVLFEPSRARSSRWTRSPSHQRPSAVPSSPTSRTYS